MLMMFGGGNGNNYKGVVNSNAFIMYERSDCDILRSHILESWIFSRHMSTSLKWRVRNYGDVEMNKYNLNSFKKRAEFGKTEKHC